MDIPRENFEEQAPEAFDSMIGKQSSHGVI